MAAIGTSKIFTFKYVNGPEVIAIGAVLPAVCIAVVALRFRCRSRQAARIGFDDWLILGAVVWIIGMGACLIDGAAKKAMGYRTPPYPANLTTQEQLLEYNPLSTELIGKLQFAFQILMMLCYGCVKISIVSFYRRIFIAHKRTIFDFVTMAVNAVLLLWTITFILIIIFDCGSHVFANWGPPVSQLAYCEKIGHTSEEGLAASDLILDFVLLILPIPSIWQLRMTKTRRVAVILIMMLGLSSFAASIARLVLYVQTIQAAIKNVPVDQNQVITLTMWWSMLESGLALIAACLPTLSSLFATWSIQSAIDSVRSALSLHSLRSSQNPSVDARNPPNPYVDLERDASTSSRTRFAKPAVYTGQAEYHMQTLESAEHQTPSSVPAQALV